MIKAITKLILIILWSLLWFFPLWVAKTAGRSDLRDKMAIFGCKGILYIIGIRLKVTGKLAPTRPLLVISNHLSYIDVLMLASVGALRFTPKEEIARWPVVGGLCRLMDAVFVSRKPSGIRAGTQAMRDALERGEVVSLFPESTTGNGLTLHPFKSSFFNIAEQPVAMGELLVQPVAMTYTHIRKLPIDSTQWPSVAWYGDMYLGPHLLKFLALGTLNAELVFLPTTTFSQCGNDRKKLAGHCQRIIEEAVESIKENSVKR